MTQYRLLCALLMVCGLAITGVTRSNAAESPKQLGAACEKGKTTACESLGDLYLNGAGAKPDASNAVALYRRTCDRGGLIGCFELAWMYEDGREVEQDYGRAMALYWKACDGGRPRVVIISR